MNISTRRKIGENPYAYINEQGGFNDPFSVSIHTDIDTKTPTLKEYANPWRVEDQQINQLELHSGRTYTNRKIEDIARSLQMRMWNRQSLLNKRQADIQPLDILDPTMAFTTLGFTVEAKNVLGYFTFEDGESEVAGIINKNESTVQYSRQMPQNTQMFTLAHELGHALLHENLVMHRDRSVVPGMTRSPYEMEADKFATYFLMPTVQVKKEFERRFGCLCLHFTENSAFGLSSTPFSEFRKQASSLRKFTRILADAEFFHRNYFTSMSEIFHVSTEAMAIRIEELCLASI
jgi:Zn-dependent peptidase ImmA (M78 family)